MAYESAGLDATLAAAAGDDPALFHELRTAFLDSVSRQIDLLGRARCDGNWRISAMRLKGLAARADDRARAPWFRRGIFRQLS